MIIRCFVALNFPVHIKRCISELISNLAGIQSDIKWITPEQIHLTMKFIGNIEHTLADKLASDLIKKVSHYQPFYIKIAGTGCFPSEKHPRIIWIGVDESESLGAIHGDIESVCLNYGFQKEERPFSPHITIGRVRSFKGMPEVIRRLKELKTADFGLVEIRGIYLMKSELKPAGAEYSSLAEIPFKAGRKNV